MQAWLAPSPSPHALGRDGIGSGSQFLCPQGGLPLLIGLLLLPLVFSVFFARPSRAQGLSTDKQDIAAEVLAKLLLERADKVKRIQIVKRISTALEHHPTSVKFVAIDAFETIVGGYTPTMAKRLGADVVMLLWIDLASQEPLIHIAAQNIFKADLAESRWVEKYLSRVLTSNATIEAQLQRRARSDTAALLLYRYLDTHKPELASHFGFRKSDFLQRIKSDWPLSANMSAPDGCTPPSSPFECAIDMELNGLIAALDQLQGNIRKRLIQAPLNASNVQLIRAIDAIPDPRSFIARLENDEQTMKVELRRVDLASVVCKAADACDALLVAALRTLNRIPEYVTEVEDSDGNKLKRFDVALYVRDVYSSIYDSITYHEGLSAYLAIGNTTGRFAQVPADCTSQVGDGCLSERYGFYHEKLGAKYVHKIYEDQTSIHSALWIGGLLYKPQESKHTDSYAFSETVLYGVDPLGINWNGLLETNLSVTWVCDSHCARFVGLNVSLPLIEYWRALSAP